MTTYSQYAAHIAEFNVETEMTDVEIFRVTPDRILAKAKRFGRMWLLRGLPPEKRSDPGLLRQLREEFDRRFSCLEPDLPLTVGMEEIGGLGPCIVEEWRDDYPGPSSLAEKGEGKGRKHRLTLRWAVILIVAFIAAAGVWGSCVHIRRLTVLSESVKADLEALDLANRQGRERMFMLADSLDRIVRDSLISEESVGHVVIKEPDKEERMANALYKERIKGFKEELARYDRYVIPEVTDDLPVFYDSICALFRCMIDRAVNPDPYGSFPQLPEDDRIRLTSHLYSMYMLSFADYFKTWIPKARAAYKEKKRENSHEKKDEQQ